MASTASPDRDPNRAAIVSACWRYPVKSLQGLPVDGLDVTAAGVSGDRARALIDVDTGRLLSAKRTSALLTAWATEDGIRLPDGAAVGLDDPDVDERLSAWLGRAVHLAGTDEATDLSFEMTFDPPNDDAEYYEIPAPAGVFVDASPVHLITTATLEGCAAARPDLDWDVRRFRPNVLVDVGGPAFVEQDWVGQRVQVGTAVLEVAQATVRCAMPLRGQADGLTREPELFAAMSELNTAMPNHLGVYCNVVDPGRLQVGDQLSVLA